VSGLRETMTRKRTDLDQRAYELRQQGLTYRAIAKWLGVTLAMARRRVLRHERMLREPANPGDRSQRYRQ
jgi:orotate phosphoribosyltransferase-like protein